MSLLGSQATLPLNMLQPDQAAAVLQAYAVAAHSAQAHCTLPAGAHDVPLMPDLLADVAPKLPDMDGIPLPELNVSTRCIQRYHA